MKYITLSKGAVTEVDDGDFEYLSQWKWHLSADGYAARRLPRNKGHRLVKMHREVLVLAVGEMGDHRNRNRLDNRRANLRKCTRQQNLLNRTKQPGTSSKYRGVSFSKQSQKWESYCWLEGRKQVIGQFRTELQAAIAADMWMLDIAGEFANPNFTPILYKSCPREM